MIRLKMFLGLHMQISPTKKNMGLRDYRGEADLPLEKLLVELLLVRLQN